MGGCFNHTLGYKKPHPWGRKRETRDSGACKPRNILYIIEQCHVRIEHLNHIVLLHIQPDVVLVGEHETLPLTFEFIN